MSAIYTSLSDQELTDDIAAFRSARRELMLGAGVAVVAGEGRRLEFTRANQGSLDAELKNLIAEGQRRGLIPYSPSGGSINLEFE
jgi:hypothetical protein